VDALLAADRQVTVWWATQVECASAIGRRERSGAMPAEEASYALTQLEELLAGWNEVPPGERVREPASRLVRLHELRAADALQLAAAIVAAEDRRGMLDVVTLDDRLRLAACREGFRVLPA
jgi:predicted nucleic acid-binding protein